MANRPLGWLSRLCHHLRNNWLIWLGILIGAGWKLLSLLFQENLI